MSKANERPEEDENLVEMHKKARRNRKRKTVAILVTAIVAVVIVVIVGVNIARNRISESVGSSSDSDVESAEVTVGSISTTVSGSGTLADEDLESIEVPSTLEISDYYVEEGESVSEGDLIATVTQASLLSAMSDAQAALDALDEEIDDASSDEVSETISAGISGRVKKIYAEDDDDVVSVMYDDGALMLLSLDGYMAVDISSDLLEEGDTVTVTTSDGDEYSGTVEENASGTATILITDNGPSYEDTVTVSDEDGNSIGTGVLYIHSQMAITGYAGTISSISVSENESISSGDTLVKLTDTETSAGYDTLLKEREDAEKELETLISIYKEGGICATADGVISTLDSDTNSSTDDTASAMTQTSTTTADSTSAAASNYTTVATISLDKSMVISISVDETDILSLSEGQEATVSIDSIGEDTYSGTVTEISTTASSSSGVTSYSAEITIDKTDDMLSGMSASVVITIEGVDNALLIPVDALHQTGSTAYVYTEYDENTGEFSGMTEVTTGLSNSSYVEITEGLGEGDIVYYTAEEDSSSSISFDFDSMGGDMDFDSMPGNSDGGFGGGRGN